MINLSLLTRENFDRWLSELPATLPFNFHSSSECMIAQFAKDMRAIEHCNTYFSDFWHQPPGTAGVAVKFPEWLMELSMFVYGKGRKHFKVGDMRAWLVELDERETVTA